MAERKQEDELIKDARLLFRNLAGSPTTFNAAGGVRTFHVILDEQRAKDLERRGWRVKKLKDREQDGEVAEGDYHLKVTVNYKTGRPPRVVLITSKGRTDLGPDEVGIIDAADIEKADILLNGYWNDMAGGGYGAYLKSAFITLREDALEQMYANMPEAPAEWDEVS